MFELPCSPDELFRLIDVQGGLGLKWNGDVRFCPIVNDSSELSRGMQIVQVRLRTNRRPKLFYAYELISLSFRIKKKRGRYPYAACRPIIETSHGCVLGEGNYVALNFSELSMHHNGKRIVSQFVRPLRLS